MADRKTVAQLKDLKYYPSRICVGPSRLDVLCWVFFALLPLLSL